MDFTSAFSIFFLDKRDIRIKKRRPTGSGYLEDKIDFKGTAIIEAKKIKTEVGMSGCKILHVPVSIYRNNHNKDIHVCVKGVCDGVHLA